MYVCVSNTVLVENLFIKHPENVCRKLNDPDVLLIITIFEKMQSIFFSLMYPFFMRNEYYT